MDGRGFDDLTRSLAGGRSRRSLLKGVLGLGSAALATTVGSREADAQWSVAVCLPDGAGGYTQRLVPKASVPLYVNRYGAVLPEGGSCPVCQPGFQSCEGGCIPLSVCCGGCPPQHVCNNGTCDCVPNCDGAVCGDDGCGGSCGSCTPPEVCDASRQCSCTPNCAGAECGDDGCGGSCGSCTGDHEVCDASRQCVCVPLTPEEACAGANCGDVRSRGCGLTATCENCPSQGGLDGTCGELADGQGYACYYRRFSDCNRCTTNSQCFLENFVCFNRPGCPGFCGSLTG